MSAPARGLPIAAFAAAALAAGAALADPPAAPAPAAPAAAPPAPAAPPAAAPKPAAAPAKKGNAKAPPPEPLPDPDLHVRVVAPSAQGRWTLHIENEGTRWLRVPADVRLLHFTIESGDTLAKKQEKPVQCGLPAGLRPEGFPDRNALLLGPGDSYTESFDPRLFCFGKDARALAGGVLVRARYGWDAPKNAKKLDAPYAVEDTAFPAVVAAKKNVVLPSMVLSYEPPEDETPDEATKAPSDADDEKSDKEKSDKDDADKSDKEKSDKDKDLDAKPPVVDQNAPKLEIASTPFVDAARGHKVQIALTISNTGHRPALAAIRTRNVGFRVEGPDGVMGCRPGISSRPVARDGFQTVKPGGSTSLTVLVEEACGRELFRRPGLYRVTPTLHLRESGSDLGLAAITGHVRAKEPTLVRISEGPDPFYKAPPKPKRAPKPEGGETTPPAPAPADTK
jgi:hypothetical protein